MALQAFDDDRLISAAFVFQVQQAASAAVSQQVAQLFGVQRQLDWLFLVAVSHSRNHTFAPHSFRGFFADCITGRHF
jgi:hypothetical protein